MKNKIIQLFVAMMAFFLILPSICYAYDPYPVCQNGIADTSVVCQDKANNTTDPLVGTNGLFRGIAGKVALVTGVVALFILLAAGFRYITSGGDAAKIKSAKDAIVYVLIGVAVILLADSIISFVLNRT